MKTYKRTLIAREKTTADAVHLVIETDDGEVQLRIPAELLNNAITGLFAGAHELSKHRSPAPLETNEAVVAAPFFAQGAGVHAEGPEESVLTVQSGPATLAIHMTPGALREAAARMEQAAQTLRSANQHKH